MTKTQPKPTVIRIPLDAEHEATVTLEQVCGKCYGSGYITVRVSETRHNDYGNVIEEKRECENCHEGYIVTPAGNAILGMVERSGMFSDLANQIEELRTEVRKYRDIVIKMGLAAAS